MVFMCDFVLRLVIFHLWHDFPSIVGTSKSALFIVVDLEELMKPICKHVYNLVF